jgi:hypothetical protein
MVVVAAERLVKEGGAIVGKFICRQAPSAKIANASVTKIVLDREGLRENIL